MKEQGSGGLATGSVERPSISLRVRSLEEGSHQIEIDRDAAVLEYPAFSGPLKVGGTLTKEGDRLHLHAFATALGHFECTRCADPFDREITAPVDVEFVPPYLESDPESDDVHVYDPMMSPYIDITQDVRDALALAIPMKHLCKPDCKGICATCGTDLNKNDCQCPVPEEIGENWSALKGLKERLRAEERKGH